MFQDWRSAESPNPELATMPVQSPVGLESLDPASGGHNPGSTRHSHKSSVTSNESAEEDISDLSDVN